MQNYRGNTAEYRRMHANRSGRMARQDEYAESPVFCQNDDQLEGLPLAMAYVPWQTWRKIYPAEKGFQCGTIFEELNKPFMGMGGQRR